MLLYKVTVTYTVPEKLRPSVTYPADKTATKHVAVDPDFGHAPLAAAGEAALTSIIGPASTWADYSAMVSSIERVVPDVLVAHKSTGESDGR